MLKDDVMRDLLARAGVFLQNPTGALLWAVRFSGMNGIHPHMEPFAALDRVDMVFF